MDKLTIRLIDRASGEVTEHEIPSMYEVCDQCEGHGTHLNPATGNDATCDQCHGKRVILVVDEEACAESDAYSDLLQRYAQQQLRPS